MKPGEKFSELQRNTMADLYEAGVKLASIAAEFDCDPTYPKWCSTRRKRLRERAVEAPRA